MFVVQKGGRKKERARKEKERDSFLFFSQLGERYPLSFLIGPQPIKLNFFQQ